MKKMTSAFKVGIRYKKNSGLGRYVGLKKRKKADVLYGHHPKENLKNVLF